MKKVWSLVVILAALGGAVTTLTDVWGSLSSIKQAWPQLAPLLPFTMIFAVWLLSVATAFLAFLVWRDVQQQRKDAVLSSIAGLQKHLNLDGGWGDAYEMLPGEKGMASAKVIADDLVAAGLIDPRFRLNNLHERNRKALGGYLARLSEYTTRHGVQQAKKNSAAIFDARL